MNFLRVIGAVFAFIIGFAIGCILAPFAGLAAMVSTRDKHGNKLDDNFVVTLLKLPFRLVWGIISSPFIFAIAGVALVAGSGNVTVDFGSSVFATKPVRGSTRDIHESGVTINSAKQATQATQTQPEQVLSRSGSRVQSSYSFDQVSRESQAPKLRKAG